MELASSTSGGGGGGGGGTAPFLLKTYDMVDDSTTDEIVSWSPMKKSFIVWNPLEFQRLLLPTYFKHNNFSSFIRQLNTYGFRKIDPERWEFANEDFVKDKRHLLKNIHRRKPIHSHSHPPADQERAAFEEEIEKLTREKNDLDAMVSGFKLQHSAAKSQLEDITQRVGSMEQRQENLLTFFQKAVQNPAFVEHLAQKIEAMDLSAYNKKRRLPLVDNFGDIQGSCRPVVSIYQQDLSNKLKLELSTAVSNMNLVSNSTNSSNEDWAREISNTETCLTFKMDSSLLDKVGAKESPEECEGHMCCQLNLSLASSPLQANQNHPCSGRVTHLDSEVGGSPGTWVDSNSNRDEIVVAPENNVINGNTGTLSSSQEGPSNDQGPISGAPARVNDHFWEQFLTERPGSSDTEHASSCYRALPHDEMEDKG